MLSNRRRALEFSLNTLQSRRRNDKDRSIIRTECHLMPVGRITTLGILDGDILGRYRLQWQGATWDEHK